MNETKTDSGADALTEEFQKILDCTIEELLEKAWKESWHIKHIEFWLKVKNARNLERLAVAIEAL